MSHISQKASLFERQGDIKATILENTRFETSAEKKTEMESIRYGEKHREREETLIWKRFGENLSTYSAR